MSSGDGTVGFINFVLVWGRHDVSILDLLSNYV
jgi:hypothetical protein